MMYQLTQKLKDGKMQVIKVPIPALGPGRVLVRNFFSLISAGTEGSTVKAARKGYIGKAKERPQQVKQVLDKLKTEGFIQTYRAVMKKLDAYSPLGYSCVGEVVDASLDIKLLKVGDYVACGGLTASHAEFVSVSENLCVKINPDTDLKQAAYNTLGAIALQGVRQADLRLGESCVVIGLGLIGQLTALLLKVSGIRVIGIDINKAMVDIAGKHCLDLALVRDDGGIEEKIARFTNGIGCDAVIITAATDSLDPINFAGAILCKRGTIVIVGSVPTGFDREPHFYKKELQLKMSCSYGPGRYDPEYEEKGYDYPPAYVRWTEQRNMQAFQQLIYEKKIDLNYLTTHIFSLENAPNAYDMMLKKSESFIGILIEYDTSISFEMQKVRHITQKTQTRQLSISIGFIGAGSYAQSHLLPNIPNEPFVARVAVMTSSSTSSRSVADRFGFQFSTCEEKDILENEGINTVFIATRHDSHAVYVLKALGAGKNVFVEKPLCLTEEELHSIASTYNGILEDPTKKQPLLMVGFNRRFSPWTKLIKEEFGDGPMAMNYRINAGGIPTDSWIQDPLIGGGRIIGEVCHFIDLLTYINGSLPDTVFATAMDDPRNLNDTVNISIKYKNGSVGSISYFANGDRSLPKEHLEIFANGVSGVLNDFRSLTLYSRGKKKEKKLMAQDKGQKNEVMQFIDSVVTGKGAVIPFEEIYNTTSVTFKIIESIKSGKTLKI